MPAIRAEMRVSEKLSPEIVGPTLKTATEILDSAYSKQTRVAQEVSGGLMTDRLSKLPRKKTVSEQTATVLHNSRDSVGSTLPMV